MRHIPLSIILFCVSGSFTLQAQTAWKRWNVSAGFGMSIPVGAFKKIAPEKSIIYYSGFPEPSGFDKDGNSAAKVGTSGSLKVNYQFHRSWEVYVKVGYTLNAVNTQPTNDYINNVMTVFRPTQTYSLSNDDYNLFFTSIGAGYTIKASKFTFIVDPGIGMAFLQSPDYEIILQRSDIAVDSHYYYDVNEDRLKSPIVSLTGAMHYDLSSRYYFGCEVGYSYANFEYTITRKSPGFTDILKSDKVTYRTVQLEIKVGVNF